MLPISTRKARVCGMMLVLLCGGASGAAAQRAPALRYRAVAGGHVRPFYLAGVADTGLAVAPFLLAERPVSNADFLQFVIARPEWRRSRVPRIAADAAYLRHWANDTVPGPGVDATASVVNVSWFAAHAYAEWRGARLPTSAEWELAASRFQRALGPSPERLQAHLLSTYGAQSSGAANPTARLVSDDGVVGLHGGPWEWVDDFNAVVTSGESRGDGTPDDGLFCAGGAALTADPGNYAAFMRYAVRGSLRGTYALATLGFRVARDAAPSPARGRQ
ncbi:MAG: formylglycine-generating enzyme family protein [Gemmatimonadaceae bacterium]|nr:formylglycine-generating enzyme family protein [Gemmatimonadaceae bacterium]